MGATTTAVTVAAVLLLAGCTSAVEDEPSAPGSQSASPGQPSTPPPTPPTTQPTGADRPASDQTYGLVGPLVELLPGLGRESYTVASVIADVRRSENAIAACMAEQGWEYWPKVPGPDQVTMAVGLRQGSREFAEQHGYGIGHDAGADGSVGGGYTTTPIPDEEAYLAALSETARRAYNLALYGSTFEEESEIVPADLQPCTSVGRTGELTDPYLAGVREEAWEFLESRYFGATFDDLNADWSTCMRDQGYGYGSPLLAQKSIIEELDAARTAGTAQTAELAELAAREIEVAVADVDCRAAVDYRSRFDAIFVAEQERYVATHQADIDALAAQYWGDEQP